MTLPHTALAPDEAQAYGPWNPGIQSTIPRALLPLATVFRPENVSTTLAEALELHDLTGLPPEELVCYRPERLAVHELLVRVTADLSVDDGPRSEDLGINFRRTAERILSRFIAPRADVLGQAHATLRRSLGERIDRELRTLWLDATGTANPPAKRGGLRRLFARAPARAAPAADPRDHDAAIIAAWEARAHDAGDAETRAACRALGRVLSAILVRHGARWGEPATIARLATDLAGNDLGGQRIGELIEPWIEEGVQAERLRRLPVQAHPLVLNTKGASASGKSTMRPYQRALADSLGVRWEDFALISPDIWRKFLLDYGSLGEHYKYAGSFTGQELRVIDQKLDHYMARKAERGAMSHLMIDRFRFDSFAPESDEAGSNLLTRFGHSVYLFFMITPPHATVERAWARGLAVGRYKAVDDLLAHNVEAYAGMPELFFTWAQSTDKRVHYEFLDNSVPEDEPPRTVAFGWNDEMNVLDVPRMLDVDRFRRIRVDALDPDQVYPAADVMAAESNVRFLSRCVRSLGAVNFGRRATGRLYARTEHGRLAWVDPHALAEALADAETRAALLAVIPDIVAPNAPSAPPVRTLPETAHQHTIGVWGASRASPHGAA